MRHRSVCVMVLSFALGGLLVAGHSAAADGVDIRPSTEGVKVLSTRPARPGFGPGWNTNRMNWHRLRPVGRAGARVQPGFHPLRRANFRPAPTAFRTFEQKMAARRAFGEAMRRPVPAAYGRNLLVEARVRREIPRGNLFGPQFAPDRLFAGAFERPTRFEQDTLFAGRARHTARTGLFGSPHQWGHGNGFVAVQSREGVRISPGFRPNVNRRCVNRNYAGAANFRGHFRQYHFDR